MKRLLLVMTFITILLLAACGPSLATLTPVPVSFMQTSAVQTALAVLIQSAPQATATAPATPTGTPLPTATWTPTPDYSLLKIASIYFQGSTEMVVVFDLNGKSGEFRLTGNEHTYTCQLSPTDANTLRCLGAYQAPGREVLFKLYEARRTDPVLIQDMIIPDSLPPTPEGMTCDIEPLWESHPEINPNYGCYAVTCYINSQYYASTEDTCVQPWRWPVP